MDETGTTTRGGGGGQRVAVTGASGLIGSALVEALSARGDHVLRLVRHKAELPGEVFWQPGAGARGGQIEEKALEGIDAAVHLAGEPLLNQRWTKEKKEAILTSRVEGTRLLARTL